MNLRLCHHVKGTVWGEKTDAHAWGRMERRVKKNGHAQGRFWGWGVAVGQDWCHETLMCSSRDPTVGLPPKSYADEHPEYETRNIKGKLLSVDYLGPS